MIFVTLGTQKFQFNRLLRMMDDLIENKKIHERTAGAVLQEDASRRLILFKAIPHNWTRAICE